MGDQDKPEGTRWEDQERDNYDVDQLRQEFRSRLYATESPPITPAQQQPVKVPYADLEIERDKLQAFKNWIHNYLDNHGIPYHPPGVHGAAGCRIGDRMDFVMAKLKEAEALRDHHEAQHRLVVFRDLPATRAERDKFFKERCDLLAERDKLTAELAVLRVANASLV